MRRINNGLEDIKPVKCLTCTLEDLSSTPRTYVDKLSVAVHAYNTKSAEVDR